MSVVTALCLAVSALGISKPQQKRACKYMPYIVQQSTEHNIDPSIVVSMIFVESSFNPWVVSPATACGLMQIIPKYTSYRNGGKKKRYTCNELKDPKRSIRVGLKILRHLLKRSSGDMARALCSYNAGYAGCKKGWKHPKTMRYVRAVRSAQRKIHRKMNFRPFSEDELLHCTIDVCPGDDCPCVYGENNVMYLNNE